MLPATAIAWPTWEPIQKYQKGKPLKLRVVGQEQNRNDWYMTFRYSFKEKIEIIPLPFLLKGGPGIRQPVQITVLHSEDLRNWIYRSDMGINNNLPWKTDSMCMKLPFLL